MNRRDLCLTSVGATVSLLALKAAATGSTPESQAKAAKHNHEGHHHAHEGANNGVHEKLATLSAQAVTKGMICADHCIEMLAQGEKDMAECLEHVMDLVAVAEALGKLAANHSQQLPLCAKLTNAVSIECAKACDKHRRHMKPCQDCYDACKELEKACQALI